MIMDKTTIHRQLQRQISKYLPENLVADHPELQKFIEVVNLSYQNYEKDAELVEQSTRLNDIEYSEINQKLKAELFKKEEIHQKLEGEAEHEAGIASKPLGFSTAVFQIILIDMVFSFDSIITAGGTAKHIEIMIAAVVIAMIVMFLFSTHISSFIHKHPTLKMLALSFLVMIGLVLIVEGWDPKNAHEMHLKNYVYFAMAFSFTVELLNMRMRKKYVRPVNLREPQLKKED